VAVQRIVFGGERTWTVTGDDHLPAGPVEEFLDHQRVARQASPNTVRSYATSLDRWWRYLAATGLAWDQVTLPMFTPYVASLRTGHPAGVAALPGTRLAGGLGEQTVAVRVAAVLSFYRYHRDVHAVPVADLLYRAGRHSGRYRPGLVHLRGGPGAEPAVRLRAVSRRPVPVLAPQQIEAILDACARWDPAAGTWDGSVRNRLLLATLAETGMRLGEALSARHCDWHAGRGGTPFVEVVPRQDHPAGARVKNSRYRRIYISDELERLHSEYVWQLCDAGAHRVVDLESHFVFVNLRRGRWLAPMRPETVYDLAASLKRQLAGTVPGGWTPHWFRHSHASALLLAGVRDHVVMRRLGHADIQTTINLYGWVSQDAELAAVADWRSWCSGWRGLSTEPAGG
jgi:integrase/recombinase XerD